MKINEQLYLKKTMSDIKKMIQEDNSFSSFYKQLDNFNIKSLQDLSFTNDLKFFESVNFILSVIISIIAHPHISSTREHIILRSDQVASLQNDMFLQTMKDPSLWKHNKEKEMIPEYVHYHQHIDELKIYENIFVVMLINMIDTEMIKYNEFYAMMIKSYKGEDNLSLSDDRVQIAFENIEKIFKKLRRIKDTYFYKEIMKAGNARLLHVTPTNILLKDRLYNFCFKFYRQLITYEDQNELIHDFASYYYILLLRNIKNRGFKLSVRISNLLAMKDDTLILDQTLIFNKKDFKIQIGFDEELTAFILNIYHRNIKISSNNLLFIDPSSDFKSFSNLLKNHSLIKFDNVEAISIWNKIDDSLNLVYPNIESEEILIDQYLNDKMKVLKGSQKLYHSYCPICKDKSIEVRDDKVCICMNCHSSYAFKDNEDELWFIKLKRC